MGYNMLALEHTGYIEGYHYLGVFDSPYPEMARLLERILNEPGNSVGNTVLAQVTVGGSNGYR